MVKAKKVKLSKRVKVTVALISIGSIIFLAFAYLNNIVNPIIIEMSQSKVRALAQKAVSSAILEVINDSALYDSLVTITRNNEGDIQLISSNALQINLLTRELSKNAQAKLEIIGEKGIGIPIGSFTGMPIFVGRGPSMPIKLLPVGAISSNFISEFIDKGINQTNHRIYLNVESHVRVIMPTETKIVTTNTQMLICESIIIGKVPETYLNASQLDQMFDLIPS